MKKKQFIEIMDRALARINVLTSYSCHAIYLNAMVTPLEGAREVMRNYEALYELPLTTFETLCMRLGWQSFEDEELEEEEKRARKEAEEMRPWALLLYKEMMIQTGEYKKL